MNTFILHSNSTIFSSNSNTINTSRIASNYDYGLSNIRENERFYYSNNNLINQRQNMQRRGFVGDRQSSSTKATASNYHFFFTPFITHNVLNESNGMGASGLNYGFISGFSGMLGDSNTLGVHLGFNYGGISGENNLTKTDIKTMGLLLGLHYKLDLVYDMYIKAIGNAFYFLNNIDYQTGLATSSKQSPNDLAFSGSLYYGKDFDFSTFGKLGLEAGVNYQGIQSDKIDFNEESYKSKLINLIYIDVGSNYTKVFDSGFGFNLNLGIKTLINEAKAKMTILGIETDFTIGADRFLGYAGAGVSYFINKQVELNLSYLGSFGDKSMSNSGFFNARFWW
ncbi:hypothetical protein CCY99_04620 [Helicobacter sp. 16-1353]|uniref:autotransporter domain-containing protein n=1 Tax=Helicobacter sp. 16-1353 TaxID=2004996 RepID=UPI000DCEB36A|nr:autotransporter domain-containing protein [Helicobacter sp. 16-1353]RAX54299.1 hypothetical protein CCY99_04620 [Helicobacter sp. 16-1353]